MTPTIAIVAAGAMGAAVGTQLVKAGLTVYTNLDGRSESTRKRAAEAGLVDLPFPELITRSDFFLSILPPSDAHALAEKVLSIAQNIDIGKRISPLVYVDCNAVNPQTLKSIYALFEGSGIKFVDASIIGGPPDGVYKPTFYASAQPEEQEILENFVALSNYGLKVKALRGEGSGIGDASALKMSYAGISKGAIGLFMVMILAANSSSPATASALLEELHSSQIETLKRLARSVPISIPKAYRWVGEMEEIAGFIGDDVAGNEIFHGLAQLFGRIEESLNEESKGGKEVEVLRKFAEDAKTAVSSD